MKLRHITEDQFMPPPDAEFDFGDCGHEVLAMVQNALRHGISDFTVIEGMVAVNGEIVPHYWIEQHGKVFDPTKSQFKGQEIDYNPPGEYRQTYSPGRFLQYWKDNMA